MGKIKKKLRNIVEPGVVLIINILNYTFFPIILEFLLNVIYLNYVQVERAIEVYEMMGQRGIPGSIEVYTEAVHACSKNGDLDTAFRIYKDLKESSVRPDEVNLEQMFIL